ncbi:MAG: heme-binding protein [Verrucomicrobiota bacterium]
MKTILLGSLAVLTLTLNSMSATEKAYPQTEVGRIEIKTLPAAIIIASTSDSGYFDSNNGLFMPLFRYIQRNDIAMTTPVEAAIQPGEMYFYITAHAAADTLSSTEQIDLQELPERRVASIGARGSYNRCNFESAKATLNQWLAEQENYKAAGPARGAFWNGPMTPGLFKRFEVHIPVIETDPDEK